MRRWLLIAALVTAAAAGYVAWPFVGLYQLGAALHGANAAEALARIDVRAVRRSIVSQVLDEATRDSDLGKAYGDLGRQLAVSVATNAADQGLEQVMTPDLLRDLIAKGVLPPGLGGEPAAAESQAGGAGVGGGTDFGVPENPLRFIQDWRFSSMKRFKTVIGETRRPDRWIGLTLKLDGLTWTLSGVTLPKEVIGRIRPALRRAIDKARS